MGTTSWPCMAHRFDASSNIISLLICYIQNIGKSKRPHPSASCPQIFWRSPCGVPGGGKAHHSQVWRRVFKILARLCGLLGFCWVLVAFIWWWQDGRLCTEASAVPGPSREIPKKITPVQDEQRDFQPKGHTQDAWTEMGGHAEIFLPRLRPGSRGASSGRPRQWPSWVGAGVKTESGWTGEWSGGRTHSDYAANSVLTWELRHREGKQPVRSGHPVRQVQRWG